MKSVDRAKAALGRARERSRLLDHGIRAVTHYVDTQGNNLAGAVTYFGFLSIFPLLIIAFAIVGFATGDNPLVTQQVSDALSQVFPRLVGSTDRAPINVTRFQDAAATASVVGSLTLLYTGLGWIGALRMSLQDVFTLPREGAPNFAVAKVLDLVALVLLGGTLLVSVSLSTVVTSVTDTVLDAIGVDALPGYALLLRALGLVLGVGTSTLLFFVMYRMLPRPELPRRALLQGALLAAVGFEGLKLVATALIGSATSSPAAAVAGTFVVLLVWINYFSRLTMLGASWAATSPPARQALPALRERALDAEVPLRAVPPPSRRPGRDDDAPALGDVLRPLALVGVMSLAVRWWARASRG